MRMSDTTSLANNADEELQKDALQRLRRQRDDTTSAEESDIDTSPVHRPETIVSKWFGANFENLHPLLQTLHCNGGTLQGPVQIKF